MQRVSVAVATGTGTTGTVNASATITPTYSGKLHGMYLDYGSVTSVTNVTLTLTTPLVTLLAVPDNATDRWIFPRRLGATQGGTAFTSTAGLVCYPITDQMRLSVSSSTPSVTAVTAHLYIEEQ
jgi:hypothetical protein